VFWGIEKNKNLSHFIFSFCHNLFLFRLITQCQIRIQDPKIGTRTKLVPSIAQFLEDNPSLHLGGDEDFHSERRKHQEIFGIYNIPKEKQHPIGEVEFTAVRGPHGTIPMRVLLPKSGEEKRKKGEAGALIYFHGGGYTIGTSEEFENGLRLLAEESGVQVRPSMSHPNHQLHFSNTILTSQ
jgi:hypothetical protein